MRLKDPLGRTTTSKRPRKVLALPVNKVLTHFEQEQRSGKALDLGCGVGRDSLYLLQNGWSVIAIDIDPEAHEYFSKAIGEEYSNRVEYHEQSFLDFPFEQYDLINASFSLYYSPEERFDELICRVKEAVAPGGRFAGSFVGRGGRFDDIPEALTLTREEVLTLFDDMTIEFFHEKKLGDEDPLRPSKNKDAHLFRVVAQKPTT